MLECPLVCISSLWLVVIEAASYPIVVTTVRIGALKKLILPETASLSTHLDTLNLLYRQYRNIDIQT